jgi:outer membrane protein TolC
MSATIILKLRESGFTDEQVSALAELVDTQAATKSDVESAAQRLAHQAAEDRTAAKADLEAAEHQLATKIEGAENRLVLKIGDARADINLLRWMTGFVLAFQLIIFSKLFLK